MRFAFSLFAALLFASPTARAADALLDYVRKPDVSFAWKQVERRDVDGFTATKLEMTSQTWRGHVWQHQVLVVRPPQVRNADIAFLFITGDGDVSKLFNLMKTLAERAGAVAAAVNRVPNQPLYDGRKEDALIAYTFNEYLKTGDREWPLLFPMAKSAVRAMDVVQAFASAGGGAKPVRFVVSGASKRGWTTWLTAAADPRVAGIAPMVIDMLNMKAQTQWSQKVYGKQSEKIGDYTELNLIERMDEPRMVELRGWVDPFSYRRAYTLPKLILLGTNDPYWTVDALRHYFHELPDPKLIFQTPNAGHDLAGGREATQTLAAFFQMIADREPLPQMKWQLKGGALEAPTVDVALTPAAKSFRLWTADSPDRDLRNDKWSGTELKSNPGKQVSARVEKPTSGYRAYLVEAELTASTGHTYKLSTEARVTPDGAPGEQPDLGNARRPDEPSLRFWLWNMMALHRFSRDEVRAATGMTAGEIDGALQRYDVRLDPPPARAAHEPLLVVPYPGGRHPRIGFLDGAVNPQRETKVSVFTPWDPASYVVVDVPEAIWSNLGLTYLAHTHVPTVWSKQDNELPKLEWFRRTDGSLDLERTLPNGIAFGAKVVPGRDGVRMELWLRNGTREKLSDLRVQNCVMLKGAKGFTAQSNDNKVLAQPYAAARSDDGKRWVITAWEPNHKPWANPPCPCIHSDPKFPDCAPGETQRVRGWLSFYEGADVQAEFKRLDGMGWR
jgi:PhoPQ-activated pathogenicity-related protein